MRETSPNAGSGLLDKPVFGTWKITWWTVLYVALIAFIVFTRLWQLDARAYCHDESIHAWEAWKLATGQGYSHNPVYHGPFLYHFTALLFVLFGDSDFTARLGTSLLGIMITLSPLFMAKWLGKKGVLVATLFMAVSPVLMHRSRFIRHDHAAIVFNLVLFLAIMWYLEQRKSRYLYLAAGAVALGFTGKETTFITYFIYGTFLFGLLVWQWLRSSSRSWAELIKSPVFDLIIVIGTLILPLASPFPIKLLGRDPLDYSQQGILFSGIVFVVVLAIGAAIGLWWDWRRWLVCAGIFYGLFIPFFTTMFTNGQGFATGMVGQLGYWLSQQGVKRGGQPWFYYIVLMSLYEFLPVLVGMGGAIFYALRGDPRANREVESGHERPAPFIALVIYWAVVAFLAYTWAGEKMPWLTMHLATPLHLLAGWAVGHLLETNWAAIRAKRGLWLLLLVPLLVYTLIRLVGAPLSFGTSTADLSQSMAWFAALVVGGVLVGFIVSIWRGLGSQPAMRLVALAAMIILLGATIRFAWMATFINADVASEFLVYAQGTPDTRLVTRELETMSRRLTGGLHMKVAYDDDSSWPFVWYLRNFDNAQFYGKKPGGPFDAEVVIVGPANEAAVKPLLGNKYYRRQYRLIWWPNQDWYNSFTLPKLWADFTNKDARQKYWDVIWNRKHEASLTAWPFVHNFTLYVRRDVTQQLWDYGPEALAVTGTLPGDEYAEKWKQLQAVGTWGASGNQPGQFRAPKGIALDALGNVYVADSYNHRVQVLDPNGQPLRQWGSEGSGQGQFKEPWGIAVGPNGDVYVADTWNHRIQVFDGEGRFKFMWGLFGEASEPTSPGNVLYGPRDIAFDQDGFLYVSDTGNKRIVKFTAEGQMVGAIGGVGDIEGQFQEPVGVAVDSEGSVYVADTWNQRIQVFDKQLNFQRSWPVYAWDGMSVVNKPFLAVDRAGNVYTTDPESYRVIAFDRQGKLISLWGQFGSDLSSMNLPTGIEVDAMGRILVTDSENHRILVFLANQP